MSWFKDKVEDYDMAGRALKRGLEDSPVELTQALEDSEDEEVEQDIFTIAPTAGVVTKDALRLGDFAKALEDK